MTARLVVVGQAPGSDWRPGQERSYPALTGWASVRLSGLGGVSRVEWVTVFQRENVLDHFPGRAGGKGHLFPPADARAAAERLAARLEGRDVVLLGSAVARAFGLVDAPPFAWVERRLVATPVATLRSVVTTPHPSRANLWWNDPANVARARAFWSVTCAEARRRFVECHGADHLGVVVERTVRLLAREESGT